jgi:hypothetical protein
MQAPRYGFWRGRGRALDIAAFFRFSRLLKNKHPAVSQGSISSKLKAQRKRPHPLGLQL